MENINGYKVLGPYSFYCISCKETTEFLEFYFSADVNITDVFALVIKDKKDDPEPIPQLIKVTTSFECFRQEVLMCLKSKGIKASFYDKYLKIEKFKYVEFYLVKKAHLLIEHVTLKALPKYWLEYMTKEMEFLFSLG